MKQRVDYSCKVAMLAMLLPVLLQSVPALAQTADNTSTLTLAVFMSGITPNGTNSYAESLDGRPFITAVELALELVNNRSDILPGYTLEFTANDSRCQSAPSVRGFIDQIFMEPTKIMIIGSDCSVSTSPVAELAPFWNLVQISPVSTSPELSMSSTFSTFLRMASSDTAIVNGIVTLMTRFNWSRTAVISQQETIFTSTFAALQETMAENNFTAPRDFTFNTGDNPQGQVERLANSPTRIIFLNVYPSYALEILCQARSERMTFSDGYVWLLFAWYQDNWWQDQPLFQASYDQISCSVSELEEILDRAILIDHFPFVENRSMTTDAGMTREEFDGVIRSRLGEDFDQSYLDQVQFAFDAVWTGALALNATQAEYDLSEFTYDQVPLSENITTSIYRNALARQFRGMSGEVAFDDTGDRNSVLRFFQYRRSESGGLTRVLIGSDESFESSNSIFPQGIPQDEQNIFINLALFIVYTILSFAGIVLALVFLAINLYFMEKKVVKFSSPYLNILIIAGAIMFYIDAIFLGVDEGIASLSAVSAFCMLRVWIASIAFSLMFGTILAKTWRVYYVFFNTTRRKKKRDKVIKDWILAVVVGCLVVIDIVFLLFVTAFSTSRLQLERNELPSNSRALPQIIGVCDAQNRFVWLGILFAYKGILLIAGVFLAFENRNTKLPQFNDSKLVGMSVYIIVVLGLVLGALGIVLETFIEAYYAVIGIMIILGTTGVLCLIFIPKIYGLWKSSDDYDVTSGPVGTTNSKDAIVQLAQEVERLQREKMELETIVGQETTIDPTSGAIEK